MIPNVLPVLVQLQCYCCPRPLLLRLLTERGSAVRQSRELASRQVNTTAPAE